MPTTHSRMSGANRAISANASSATSSRRVVPGARRRACTARTGRRRSSTCLPVRRDRRVVGGVEVQLGPARRRLARAAALERRLGRRRCRRDRSPSPGAARRPGPARGERRQASRAAVDLDHRACPSASRRPAAAKAAGAASPQSAERACAGRRWRPRPRADQRDPSSSTTPSPGRISATGTPAAITAPASSRGARRWRTTRCPSRPGRSPTRPAAPSSVPMRVHGVDRRGARVARARPRADDALAVQRGAQPLVAARSARRPTAIDSSNRTLDELGVVPEQLLERRPARARRRPRCRAARRAARPDARRRAPRSACSRRRRREPSPRRCAMVALRVVPEAERRCRRRTGTRGAGRRAYTR